MANATTKKLNGDELARIDDAVTDIEQIAKQYGLAASRNEPPIKRAIRLSQGVAQLRVMLDVKQVEFLFGGLQGTTLGFLTDKTYPSEVVRDCLIEALLRGYMPVGNEFNIIGGKFYAAKNGLERQLREWPGLHSLDIIPGVPAAAKDGTALVPYTASWTLDGKEYEIRCVVTADGEDRRIPVRVNAGMGPDAVLGKAERKLYWRILKKLSGEGTAMLGPEDEPSVIVTTDAPAVTERANDGRRMRLGRKQAETEPERQPGEEG